MSPIGALSQRGVASAVLAIVAMYLPHAAKTLATALT
jgi:hypothetical protein